MNPQELQNKIAEYYAKLPPSVAQAFASMTWLEDLRNISSTYGLTQNQISTLATETTLVFLGIISMEDYEKNLISELSMTKDIADKMILEINTKILNPIRGDLNNAYMANSVEIAQEKFGSDMPLDERFANIPKEVVDAIEKSDWENTVVNVANKYKLNIEQTGILSDIVVRVMLNIVHPDKIGDEIIKTLKTSQEDTNKIVTDLNDQVFKNIREALKKNFEKPIVSEIEIPIPPYKKIEPTIPENLPIHKDDALSNAGIQIINDSKNIDKVEEENLSLKEDTMLIKDGINIIKPAPATESIVGAKLFGTFAKGTQVSDHTISKTNGTDAYREPLV